MWIVFCLTIEFSSGKSAEWGDKTLPVVSVKLRRKVEPSLVAQEAIIPQGQFSGGSGGKESTCNAGDLGSVPGFGRSLENKMATHSSIVTWKVPWAEKPGGNSPWDCKESDTTEQVTLPIKSIRFKVREIKFKSWLCHSPAFLFFLRQPQFFQNNSTHPTVLLGKFNEIIETIQFNICSQ